MGNQDDDNLVEVPVLLVLSREVVRRMRKLSVTNGLTFQSMASMAVEVGFDQYGACVPRYPTAHGQRVGVYPEKPAAVPDCPPGRVPSDERKNPENAHRSNRPIDVKEAAFRAGEHALREYSRGQADGTEGHAASGSHPGTDRPPVRVPRRRRLGSPLVRPRPRRPGGWAD